MELCLYNTFPDKQIHSQFLKRPFEDQTEWYETYAMLQEASLLLGFKIEVIMLSFTLHSRSLLQNTMITFDKQARIVTKCKGNAKGP